MTVAVTYLPTLLWPPPLVVDPPFWTQHALQARELVKAANYTVSFRGVRFYDSLYPFDLIQRVHVESGDFWESKELVILSSSLRDGAVVFDVGANIGNHAIYWATQTNTRRVYAFEPMPATFALLSRNVELNGLQGTVVPINAAVGDLHEKVAVESYSVDNIGGARVKKHANGTIPAIRLDDFEFPEQQVDLLKIDVEGFECRVVTGARSFLEKFHPARIFIEVLQQAEKAWIHEAFTAIGYRKIRAFGADNFIYEFANGPNQTSSGGPG
jgi:FkbM family methyltransferase